MIFLSQFFNIFSSISLIIFCKFLFMFAETAPLNLDTDKEALISLRSQINVGSPNPLSSWDVNTSPCNWTGVSCNKNGVRVVSVNLSDMGLAGSLSPSIANLSFLRSLQLQNNRFSGSIPEKIGNLFRLRVLNLSSNSLRGSIPLNISNLLELELLDLTMNNVSGIIPEGLSLVSRLRILKLGRNFLSGPIPPSLSNLSALVELSLGTNSIGGMIPSDLSNLKNLKVLDLTINNLTGIVPSSIYNMSSLVTLALASNQLWGTIPSDVGEKLPNLLVFNFCINKFTGGIPGSLHNLTNIRVIRMAHNLLEGTVPPGLGNLPFLEMYNIGYNRIVNTGDDDNGQLDFITSLTNSSRLQFLALDGNRFRGRIPESVGNLSKVLQKLYMGQNQIYGSIPASIGNLSGLTLLNLSDNAVTGGISPEIGRLKELQVLELARNRISERIPDALGDLKRLIQIDLSGNMLEGPIPSTFGNFQSLLSMDLSNNRITGTIPKEILSLSSLSTVFNLSNNFLTGNLYSDIGRLESVVTIDLSSNNLSGNIPSSIRNCRSLEKLFLSRNMFSGAIPETLGEVKALETLELSHNNLSGEIPSNLENLTALQSLDLSFNNLEGPVPCGGVFKTLPRTRLEGNPKLLHVSVSDCRKISPNHTRKRAKFSIIIASAAAATSLIIVLSLIYTIKTRKRKNSTSPSQILKAHQLISYEELREATENFKEENLLGNGSFGSVFKGCLRDGSVVAIKVLNISTSGSWKSFAAECNALRTVRHRNLVKLITSCSSLDYKKNEFVALIYEFLRHGSLEDWIHGRRQKDNGEKLNILERLNIAIDVASALDYLHHDCEIPVVHCDLKPGNVLLDENMTAKVGDFGLARLLGEKSGDGSSISSTHVLKGSFGYIPPEYGMGSKPSTKGDTYSYGVMLLELFTGKSPRQDRFAGGQNLNEEVQTAFPNNVEKVADPTLLPLMEVQTDCLVRIIGVALACAAPKPDGRITMRDALSKLTSARTKLLA